MFIALIYADTEDCMLICNRINKHIAILMLQGIGSIVPHGKAFSTALLSYEKSFDAAAILCIIVAQ
jgi:hypothetical protein